MPQVHGKKNKEDFQSCISFLESVGYRNYWQDLNAKDFGVPHNRERCFMVSLLGNYTYHFPLIERERELKLTDVMENTVEEKYYLHSDKAKKLIEQLKVRNALTEQSEGKICVDGTINNPRKKEIANCITARYDCGVSNQRSTGNMVVEKIRIKQPTKKGYIECENGGTEIKVLTDEYNIRKLTPRECGRLMGVADEDITKMEKVNSNSQLYKQFGNSIVVDVLCAIFKQLNIEQEKEN